MTKSAFLGGALAFKGDKKKSKKKKKSKTKHKLKDEGDGATKAEILRQAESLSTIIWSFTADTQAKKARRRRKRPALNMIRRRTPCQEHRKHWKRMDLSNTMTKN